MAKCKLELFSVCLIIIYRFGHYDVIILAGRKLSVQRSDSYKKVVNRNGQQGNPKQNRRDGNLRSRS